MSHTRRLASDAALLAVASVLSACSPRVTGTIGIGVDAAVNTELLALYWRIGHTILNRQDAEGWGTRVIDRLATDLRAAYPQMRGLSRSNLFYMRSFAACWPQEPIVQQAVGRLPWGHVTVLLDSSTTSLSGTGTPPPPPSTGGLATSCSTRL